MELAERPLGKGYDVRVYDRNISLSRLVGPNREYIARHIPHLRDLLDNSVENVVADSEVCVVGCTDPSVVTALDADGDRTIIVLVRLPDAEHRRARPGYVGLGW